MDILKTDISNSGTLSDSSLCNDTSLLRDNQKIVILHKVNKIWGPPPPQDGFLQINCLSWYKNNVLKVDDYSIPIPLYELSPYHLKTEDGYLFENWWQSLKLYPIVNKQEQIKCKWYWPLQQHITRDFTINTEVLDEYISPDYWNWRKTLQLHTEVVRYPNGFNGRHTCKCAIIRDPYNLDKYITYDYISARKKLYISKYAECVVNTRAFQMLKGISYQKFELLEIDCPAWTDTEFTNHKHMVTRDTFTKYINRPNPAFGHTWCLAMLLQGYDISNILQ